MLKAKIVGIGILAVFCVLSCNDGMSFFRNKNGENQAKRDRSKRTVIDDAEYIDFTIEKYNAHTVKLEDVLFTLNNNTFKNGNSVIKIKTQEKTIEFSSDDGRYNGKENCQIYGRFVIDVKAASGDCLYLRKDPRKDGFVMIDGEMFHNDAVPDLIVCLPLYGYSRNRIEVSSIMDGYIVMPSGTYWKQ